MTGVIWRQSNNTSKIFQQFLSHLFAPRKKSIEHFVKSYKKTSQYPHQGRRECERRRRQLREGKISNYFLSHHQD